MSADEYREVISNPSAYQQKDVMIAIGYVLGAESPKGREISDLLALVLNYAVAATDFGDFSKFAVHINKALAALVSDLTDGQMN